MPATGVREFMAKVDSWVVAESDRAKAVAVEAIQLMCEAVVRDTPVHNGYLRGGWQPSLNSPAQLIIEGRADPTGGLAMADIAVVIHELKLGDVFYFSNGVIYARRIEYGFVGEDSLGRHYNQAGRFYLSNNAARWQDFVSSASSMIYGGAP